MTEWQGAGGKAWLTPPATNVTLRLTVAEWLPESGAGNWAKVFFPPVSDELCHASVMM